MRRLFFKSAGKVCGSTIKLPLKLEDLSVFEVGGMRGVAVECVDIRKNTSGEGELLDCN